MCLTLVATPQTLEAHLNHLARKAVARPHPEQTRQGSCRRAGSIGSAHKLYRGALAFYPAAATWPSSMRARPAARQRDKPNARSRCARKTRWRR